jgi:hypothetical protein
MAIEFALRRYNTRRRQRGAEAAEVEIIDEGGSMLLWMSPTDIENNIKEFGPHPGLLAAKAAYALDVEVDDH